MQPVHEVAVVVPVTKARVRVRVRVHVAAPVRPAPAVSEIYSVSASPSVVHDGESVVWDVRTSPDIQSVTATTTLISLPLSRFAPGHFGLTFTVPKGVPPFFHGTYNMSVNAVSSSGATLRRGIALTFL